MPLLMMFARRWWKEIAIGLAVLAAVMWYKHLTGTIEEQAQQIVSLTTENVVLKENNVKLERSIEANNAAITKLAAGAADTNKNFAALGTTVRTQSSTLEQRLRGILAEKKPLSCEETIQYLVDGVKDLK